VTGNPQDHYIEDPVRDLERVVNGMTYKVSQRDPNHKARARDSDKPLVVSLSERPKLRRVRSGIAYDAKTDSYVVVCHASVGVPPRRFRSFGPALEFARTGNPSGGEPVVVTSMTRASYLTGGSRVLSSKDDLSCAEGPPAVEDTLFDSLVERIDRAYDELNHHLGWRFLYAPSRSLMHRIDCSLSGRIRAARDTNLRGRALKQATRTGWRRIGGPTALSIRCRSVGCSWSLRAARP
jgi:hypothetical protein